MYAMGTTAAALYRGIAVELHWNCMVSTNQGRSLRGAAQNFMNQSGGSVATFLTLHTKKVCDISSLSFHGNDKSIKDLRK